VEGIGEQFHQVDILKATLEYVILAEGKGR
jgi:hypothetical protein